MQPVLLMNKRESVKKLISSFADEGRGCQAKVVRRSSLEQGGLYYNNLKQRGSFSVGSHPINNEASEKTQKAFVK